IANEARQSSFDAAERKLNRFVALLLAMMGRERRSPDGAKQNPGFSPPVWSPGLRCAPSGLQTFAQSIMPVLVDPGVGRDDGRARLAPHHPMKIQNRFRKTLRILLRRIVPDLVEHAPLVLRTEMLGVPLGILYRVHPVDGAVNIDGGGVDFRLRRQSRLDAAATG